MKKAISEGTLEIGDFKLKCVICKDGTRLIEQQSMIEFFEYLEKGGTVSKEEARMVAKFCQSEPDVL